MSVRSLVTIGCVVAKSEAFLNR